MKVGPKIPPFKIKIHEKHLGVFIGARYLGPRAYLKHEEKYNKT